MPKPIFIVTGDFPDDEINKFQRLLQSTMEDYHVLVCFKDQKELTFEAFYPSDFNDIDMEELKRKANLSFKKEEA